MGQKLAEHLGVTEESLIFVKFDGQNLLKYKVTGYNEEDFQAVIDAEKKDDLEWYYKSEPIPSSNDQPVKVVVGNNFDELVVNDKWVLLELYAPWCGHCKKLAPVYDELAKVLLHNKDLTISKMDYTANERKEVQVKGFPTLILFSPSNEQFLFKGERTLEGM